MKKDFETAMHEETAPMPQFYKFPIKEAGVSESPGRGGDA